MFKINNYRSIYTKHNNDVIPILSSGIHLSVNHISRAALCDVHVGQIKAVN